jgi:AcrR family transcriptional regulator
MTMNDRQVREGNSAMDDMNGSVRRILEGALLAISQRGASMLSMTDIASAAKVSRATLYRYFPHKEQLFAELSDYIVNKFNQGVMQAAAEQENPRDKFEAVLQFIGDFTVNLKSDRIMEVEPKWILEARRSNFYKQLDAVNEALAPVYDDLDKRLGVRVDRAIAGEIIFRFLESTTLIPSNQLTRAAPKLLPDMLEYLLMRIAKNEQ